MNKAALSTILKRQDLLIAYTKTFSNMIGSICQLVGQQKLLSNSTRISEFLGGLFLKGQQMRFCEILTKPISFYSISPFRLSHARYLAFWTALVHKLEMGNNKTGVLT